MTFSIISPLYVLSESLLEKTRSYLSDIQKSIQVEDEFIIVDNGSTLGKEEFMKISNVYIRTPENLGYGGAINLGMKVAKGDYFVFPNNDIRVSVDWREKILEVFQNKTNVGAVSYCMPEVEETWGIPFTGIFWGVRREVYEKVGLFDEDFELGREQDTDYYYRLLLAGFDMDTAKFELKHERRSTYDQPEFIKRHAQSSNYQDSPFEKKWGFNHNDYYRRGLVDRKNAN